MRLRRLVTLLFAVVLLFAVFALDVVRKSVDVDLGGMGLLRALMVIGAFALLYIFLERAWPQRVLPPIKRIGQILIATLLVLAAAGGILLMVPHAFEEKGDLLFPRDYGTVFVSSVVSVLLGLFALLVFRNLRHVILYKQRKGTRRNFAIFAALALLAAVTTVRLDPLESFIVSDVVFGLGVLFAFVNSFRLSWIVYLTRREKLTNLAYSFVLFLLFIALNVLLVQSSHAALRYYSYPLERFLSLVCLLGNIYSGVAFVSTLFHLPTAEAFERKSSEVTSLHSLGRLTAQVLDFQELAASVTSMTLQVCEASSSWLEVLPAEQEDRRGGPWGAEESGMIEIAGRQNIDQDQIDLLVPRTGPSVRDQVMAQKVPLVMDDLKSDPRFKKSGVAGSLVVVPLVSHRGMVGILYALKQQAYGFFRDDVEMISAFADHATIALENSRLFRTSLEKERLTREMVLAQEMQQRLLPQQLPRLPGLEISAMSTPAQEVGGDYYDFASLDHTRLGIIVGDVSGKGISAALYMSEVKGIFQALSGMYDSPRQLLLRANDALSRSIDRHSFVSVIYGILDIRTGLLNVSRAGHCPLLHVGAARATFHRPVGMGLGMGDPRTFEATLEESVLPLQPGDVCVFYTDGLTEARNGDQEFGFDRLRDVVRASAGKGAVEIKNAILEGVSTFGSDAARHDDLTLVVIKWHGHDASRTDAGT